MWFLLIIILVSAMDLSAAQKEVKVCQNDSLQFTLKRLITRSGVSAWQANLTAFDRPLRDYFVDGNFILKFMSYGSDSFPINFDGDLSGFWRLGRFRYAAINQLVLDNLQDLTYFSEPRTRVRTTYSIPITNPNISSIAFGFGFIQKTGFPIVHSLYARDLVLCPPKVGKY